MIITMKQNAVELVKYVVTINALLHVILKTNFPERNQACVWYKKHYTYKGFVIIHQAP